MLIKKKNHYEQYVVRIQRKGTKHLFFVVSPQNCRLKLTTCRFHVLVMNIC